MPDIHTFLPPPPGVELLTAWDDANGELYAERMPLVCIKVYASGGIDEFDAIGVDGDCLGDDFFPSIPARALLLPDGRVVVPRMETYSSIDGWLASVKEQKEEAEKRCRASKARLQSNAPELPHGKNSCHK